MPFLLIPPALLILLFLPGWSWRPSRPRLLSIVLLSLCCTTWAGLLLAEVGWFSTLNVMLVDLGISALGWKVRGQRRREALEAHEWWSIGVAAFGLVLALPPLDTRLGAGDSTAYLAGGRHLAQSGSLVIHDRLLDALPLDLKRAWFPSVAADRGSAPYARLTGAFILRSLDKDEVITGFHHTLLVWVALAYDLAGDGTYAASLFAALSLWSIFNLLRVWLPAPWAAGWAVVFGLMAPQIWYSRFLMPEVASGVFVWAGLAILAQPNLSNRDDRQQVILGGLALGLAGLMRIENALFIGAPLLLWTIHAGGSGPPWRTVAAAAALPWAHAVIHLSIFRTHYWGNLRTATLDAFDALQPGLPLLAVGVGLIAVSLMWKSLVATTRGLVALGWLAIAVAVLSSGAPQARLFAAYTGAPFGILGFLALAWIVLHWQQRSSVERIVAMLAVMVGLQWLLAPHATPVPLWTTRRAVPILIPSILVLIALAAWTRARWRQTISLAAIVAIAATELPLLPDLRNPLLYRGSRTHVRTIGQTLPMEAVVLLDPSLIALGLGPGLWMDRSASVFAVDPADARRILLLAASSRARPLFWLGNESTSPPQLDGFTLSPHALYQFALTTPDLSLQLRPGVTTSAEYTLAIYRVEPASGSARF